jgi:adenine-specific DNA-methyltransferase
MSHAGRIRCIYIDPPYNTGNRDFVYNDRFVDKTHRFRHSLWLEFMYRRLVLARELLADDGVIFVSIDDNELFRLGMLMDRVFGEDNWLQTLIWKKSYGGGSKAKHVVGLHEYVLCFAGQKELVGRIDLPPDPKVLRYYKFRDEKFDQRGPYRLQPLATNSMDTRSNLRYPIPYQGEDIWPAKQWQWARERAMAALEADELVFTKKSDVWTVNYKQYLRDENGEERGSKPYSVLDGPYTQEGTAEVRNIFGDGKAFTFPKPSGLLAHLVSYVPKDAVILDFFAGSGTTAHAVAKLNAEDGGSRRFILVSSTEATEDAPDKNLCRDVCAERVRRVLGGYVNAKGENIDGLGGGFAYLRARRIPRHRLLL